MNHFIEYVCRGVVRSEDAIRRLNHNVRSLAKCNRNLATSVICLGVSGLLMTYVLLEQNKDIAALKKQVADLAKPAEDVPVADNVEEVENQEGA